MKGGMDGGMGSGMDGGNPTGKAGVSGTKWKPSKPVRLALLAAMAALFAGVGLYGLWQGKLIMPYRQFFAKRWNAHNIYLYFYGSTAQLMSVAFLFVAAGLTVFMIQLIRAEPGTKIDKTLYAALVLTGFILIVALYALKLNHVI